jgi:isoleucyl-tRNA synthetase
MKYKQGTRRRALEYEKALVEYWKANKTFEKSVENRPVSSAYVFYDGPPFITGSPHHGTLLSSIVKDAVPRFWTMQGKRVERVWGWDCHGLPAEVFTEKKLGITDKRDIGTKISLEEYIKTCRENMVQTGSLWEDTIDRIGRWVDFKGAYRTMDKEYMESVWWAFKTLYEKGKIYEGEKVLMYCTRDATPLAKAEIAMDNSYKDVTDPSVYTIFEAGDKKLLVWTTTPWTLSGNTALAVGKDITYVEVAVDGQQFVLAKSQLEKVLKDDKNQPLTYEVIDEFKGSKLVGQTYTPLAIAQAPEGTKFAIYGADFVTEDGGTGIVHIAPAYGEDDYSLYREHPDIAFVMTTNEEGEYLRGEWQGKVVWDVNKDVSKSLKADGTVWKIEYIKHSYPHCYRCGTKLMYRALPSWFMDIEGQRTEMLAKNSDNVQWFPEHLKHGRFQKNIEQAPDWNLSRDRFWATAMPVWKAVDKEGREHVKVVGSYAELKELSGVELEDYHRPWVDDITFTIDGLEYKRIEKVLDCWFESGSMSFAQFHYPFENKEKFEASFPGDFIVEYIGQVRAWFYYMHAVSIGLFGENSFKNVITTGTLAGNDGRKMSKSFGNYTDPNELMDQYSADSLRFLLMSSPVLNGEDFSLLDKDVGDVARKLSMVWNMYDFFTMYADVDNWEWDGSLEDPSADLQNSLDKWIVSRVHELNIEIEKNMKAYDLPSALKPILPFIDDASNWYVRRSRRRFWKSGSTDDKNDAYRTLHYVLVHLSMIMAPLTPFLAEELYQKLTGGESVHLLDWPTAGHVNELSVRNMAFVRAVINDGLSQRARSGVKVRQPLQSVSVHDKDAILDGELQAIICEELNVKEVITHTNSSAGEVVMNFELTTDLKREGLAREVIRHVQSCRKQAGLQVDDRIKLSLDASGELQKAILAHKADIEAETLGAFEANTEGFELNVQVEGQNLTIRLTKQ